MISWFCCWYWRKASEGWEVEEEEDEETEKELSFLQETSRV